MDVSEWLRTLGLEQYEPAFRHNEIDIELLPSLTAEDLKDLGITLVGHRRRLLEAAAALRGADHSQGRQPARAAATRQPAPVCIRLVSKASRRARQPASWPRWNPTGTFLPQRPGTR